MKKSRYVRNLEGRRSEKMVQSNTSCPRGPEVLFESCVMAIEVAQNKEISGGRNDGGRKGVGSAISLTRANGGTINIKK